MKQNENIVLGHDSMCRHSLAKLIHRIQHMSKLVEMARLARKVTPKFTTPEDGDQSFIAHARIEELKMKD